VKELKRLLFRCFFALEIVMFAYFYTFGSQGLPAWFALQKETSILEQEITVLQNEIATFKKQIALFEQYSLLIEKVAREQLQLARSDDYIFYFK